LKKNKIDRSKCVIGWYTTIGKPDSKTSNHIIYNGKPICGFYVPKHADLDVVSFALDMGYVECKNCVSVWKKNEQVSWKYF